MPVTIEENGVRVQVVEPGTTEDPFTKGQVDPSQTQAQVPASAQPPVPDPAAVETPPAPVTPPVTQEPSPAPAPAAQEAAEAVAQVQQVVDATTDTWSPEELEALTKLESVLNTEVEEQVEVVRRQQQSTHDRQMSRLQDELKARDERIDGLERAQREMILNSGNLSDVQKAEMKAQWDLEDKEKELSDREALVDEKYRVVVTNAFVMEFGEYGVTKEQLDECETADDMEVLCLEAKADHFERKATGQTTAPAAQPAVVTVQPAAEVVTPAPAGATRASDVGGGGSAPNERPAFREDQSPDAIAENLKNLEQVHIKLG